MHYKMVNSVELNTDLTSLIRGHYNEYGSNTNTY